MITRNHAKSQKRVSASDIHGFTFKVKSYMNYFLILKWRKQESDIE